jgi:hypothetical protein
MTPASKFLTNGSLPWDGSPQPSYGKQDGFPQPSYGNQPQVTNLPAGGIDAPAVHQRVPSR